MKSAPPVGSLAMSRIFSLGIALAVAMLVGCSASNSSSSNSSNNATSTTNNVQPIAVNTGPAVVDGLAAVDTAFTSVTLCVPGTTTCQTVTGVLVDTGSSGLRILSSALTLSLPQQTSGGAPVAECGEFTATETWGGVQSADIEMAGEKASSVAVQVIGSANVPSVPASCSSLGQVTDDLPSLGANGILGVGNFVQDCGPACAVSGSSNAGFYYTCPTSTSCAITSESLSQQLSNPVASFATDNNGVIIELPLASGPEATLNGSMIFGIGTQSGPQPNNALGSATVYGVNTSGAYVGDFTTTFMGTAYPQAFLDTGSNGIYFLDTSVTGLPECSDYNFWYCPTTTQNFSAVNEGANGATGSLSFSIGNADSLVANVNNGVAPNLGGPGGPNTIDWGLPFFFGRNVFTAIEGKSAPGGNTPYWAF